jgi:hypothetical protein
MPICLARTLSLIFGPESEVAALTIDSARVQGAFAHGVAQDFLSDFCLASVRQRKCDAWLSAPILLRTGNLSAAETHDGEAKGKRVPHCRARARDP